LQSLVAIAIAIVLSIQSMSVVNQKIVEVEDSAEDATETTKNESIPKPYRLIYHPYLSWTDVFINYVLACLLNLTSLNSLDPKSKEASEILSKIRNKCEVVTDGFMARLAIKKWSDSSQCAIAEHISEIPFQPNILKDWNITDDTNIVIESASERETVKVLVRFPSSLLTSDERENATVSETSGCLIVKELDLINFALDVPVVIQFHGGGLVSAKPTLIAEIIEMLYVTLFLLISFFFRFLITYI
jgi:hypothetical protein